MTRSFHIFTFSHFFHVYHSPMGIEISKRTIFLTTLCRYCHGTVDNNTSIKYKKLGKHKLIFCVAVARPDTARSVVRHSDVSVVGPVPALFDRLHAMSIYSRIARQRVNVVGVVLYEQADFVCYRRSYSYINNIPFTDITAEPSQTLEHIRHVSPIRYDRVM